MMLLKKCLLPVIFLLGLLSSGFDGYSVAIVKTGNLVETALIAPESNYLKGSVFVKLSAKEFSVIRGKKMSFLERLYFKSVKKRVKRELKTDPDMMITKYYDDANGKFKIDGIWFVIGSLVGPLGILFAFTTNQPKNNRISAVLGSVVFLVWFGYIFVF